MVIIHLRKWLGILRFMAILIVLSCFMMLTLRYFASWVDDNDRYRKPDGIAIKAFDGQYEVETDTTILDRLLQFYRYGE